MKIFFIILGVLLVAVIGYTIIATNTPQDEGNDDAFTGTTTEESMNNFPVAVTPIEHASVVFEWNGRVIYVDPVGDEAAFAGVDAPDLILLTDIHGDHLSTSTLERITGSSTQVIAPQAVADLLPPPVLDRTTVLQNNATSSVLGFTIEAVPMYNLPEADDSRHPKGRGNGYVIEQAGTRVYVAGDTDDTEEMRSLEDIDIAFIPMNPPFTMDVETAAEAVLAFSPRAVYPYHYRGEDGLSDISRFRQLVNAGNPDIEVVLLDWYPNGEGL